MPRQALVVHEQQLHRFIEGDLVLAEQSNAPAAADALHGGFDAVRIDALGLRAFEACEDRAVRAMARPGECERAVEAHRDLLGRSQQAIALKSQRELARRPHRAHGVRARRPDAYLENVENA